MRLAFALFLLSAAAVPEPGEAQILNVRPAPLADLRSVRQARHGEVVLGQTTLISSGVDLRVCPA